MSQRTNVKHPKPRGKRNVRVITQLAKGTSAKGEPMLQSIHLPVSTGIERARTPAQEADRARVPSFLRRYRKRYASPNAR